MNAINPMSGANTALSAASPSSSEVGREFNSFIKLLTAQVKNQDPLAPLDSTQFVEQLATFSALEQQVQSNSTLQGISAGIGQMQALLMALGAPVSPAPQSSWLGYEGGPVDFEFDAPQGAASAALIVRDAAGEEISRTALNAGQGAFSWDGMTVPEGERRMLQFSIEFSTNGSVIGSAPVRFI